MQKPCADDGGDYKCMMKNEFGQLQAKLNLNIEAEPAAVPQGQAPTFVEKPKIVTKEEGKLIMMIVRYRAEAQCECLWSFKETRLTESSTVKFVHEKDYDYWESRVELTVELAYSFPPANPCHPVTNRLLPTKTFSLI